MRKGERTRQHIVETAASVLNRHGYAGSGMTELMRETGLAKGGLYRHFESKQKLAVEAFNYAFGRVYALRFAHLDQVPNSVDKLRKFISGYASVASPIPGGCPILNTTIENDDGNPALLRCAEEAFDSVIGTLTEVIGSGQQRGEIRSEVVPSELALFIYCSLEGAIFASRLEKSRNRIKIVGRYLEQFLESEVRFGSGRTKSGGWT